MDRISCALVAHITTLFLLGATTLASAVSLHDVVKELDPLLQEHIVNTPLTSSYGWRDCQANTVLRPSNTEQVSAFIRKLHEHNLQTGQKYTIRATHDLFMSHNNLTCDDSAEGVHSVLIDMSGMLHLLELDADRGLVRVQAGIMIEDLQEMLHNAGLTLPGMIAVPPLSSMTLGGTLATASHGSALKGPGTLGSFIERAVVVDGTGTIHTLKQLDAANVIEGTIGLLGVVTEISLFVDNQGKIAVEQATEEDWRMVAHIKEFINHEDAESMDVLWNVASGHYNIRLWQSADSAHDGVAKNTLFQGPHTWLNEVDDMLYADQTDQQDERALTCQIIGDLTTFPHFTEEDMTIAPYHFAIGWAHHMSSVSCHSIGECMWQYAKVTPFEFAMDSRHLDMWVEDVKAILLNAKTCPPFFIHFRFIPASVTSDIAMHTGIPVTVYIDISTFSSTKTGLPKKVQYLHEEIVQLTLCRYHGRPHWGMGTSNVFLNNCPVRDMYPQFDEFLEQQKKYDPAGFFIPPLFNKIINREGPNYYKGCAVDGECFCAEDIHCADGYRCVPGSVFPEYKVCMPAPTSERAAPSNAGESTTEEIERHEL